MQARADKADKVEAKFPFKLFLRVRPQKSGNMELMDYYKPKDEKVMHIVVPKDSFTFSKGRLEGEFEYDHIFLPKSSQEKVFDVTTKDLLNGFLKGKSCLIMAYGVTGSGKTYTVLGPQENRGLIPRTLEYILTGMGTPEFQQQFKDKPGTISLEMSFLEDYQNCIYDLLSPSYRVGVNTKPSLIVRCDSQGILHVPNLTEKTIKTIKEGMDLIELGTREKHMAETSMNVDSSRSHTVCTFNLVHRINQTKEILASCRLVDLAGSERASRTNVTGERTKEAGAINSDLLFLMQCLRTLTENSRENIRSVIRNCKLTHLLSSSMIGTMAGPVHMIVNASNEKDDFDETFYVFEKTTIVKSIKSVQTRIDKSTPVMHIPGLHKKENITPFRPNAADYIRLKKELDELKESRNQEMDILELQVRQEIVQEIQRRRQNGEKEDSQIWSMLEGMKVQYALMEEELVKQNKSRIEDLQLQIQDLLNQLGDIEDENQYLSKKVELLTSMPLECSSIDTNTNNPASYEEILEHSEKLLQENRDMKSQIHDLKARINQMQEEMGKANPEKQEYQALKDANESILYEKQVLVDEKHKLEEDLYKLREENQKLQSEVTELKEQNQSLQTFNRTAGEGTLRRVLQGQTSPETTIKPAPPGTLPPIKVLTPVTGDTGSLRQPANPGYANSLKKNPGPNSPQFPILKPNPQLNFSRGGSPRTPAPLPPTGGSPRTRLPLPPTGGSPRTNLPPVTPAGGLTKSLNPPSRSLFSGSPRGIQMPTAQSVSAVTGVRSQAPVQKAPGVVKNKPVPLNIQSPNTQKSKTQTFF